MKHVGQISACRQLSGAELELVSGGGSSNSYMVDGTEVTDYFDDGGNYVGSSYDFSDGSMDYYDRASGTIEHFDSTAICAGLSGGYVTGQVCTAMDGTEWGLRGGLSTSVELTPQIDAINTAEIGGLDVGTDTITYGITGTQIEQTAGTVIQDATDALSSALEDWMRATSPDAASMIYDGQPPEYEREYQLDRPDAY